MKISAALALVLLAAGCGDVTTADIHDHCPAVVRDMIASQIGETSDFEVSEAKDAAIEGTATAGGQSLWWWCGKGIATVGKVNVMVRDAKTQSSIIDEFVDL